MVVYLSTSSKCYLLLTHLQQFHSGLEGFDSLSPAALCETLPEQAAAAPRTDWSPVTPALTWRVENSGYTQARVKTFVPLTNTTNTHLKAASSSDSIVFSLSDAVSWTTRAALSLASSPRLRPASSKATSFLWPSPLARLNSDAREVTSPQSCQQRPNR